MTVGATDVAFGDFGPNLVDWPQVPNHRADCRTFDVADMIELEHGYISLAAVNAWMIREIAEHVSSPFGSHCGVPVDYSAMVRSRANALDICCTIYRLASLANTMPPPFGFVPKTIIADRFRFAAASTPLHTGIFANACASVLAL